MGRFVQIVTVVVLILFLLPGRQVNAAPRVQNIRSEEKVVIVIDPGHGGENLGTTENNHTEKFMTMTTALAMYEELLLYDNVEVHLTHTDDQDVSLKKRAEFAASVDADFLFSIHYNASENHEMFGAEVWVSAFPPYNGYGYQFGCEILTDIRETGLLLRGVKTRFNSKGEDYYGIIRESVDLGVPAVIIEHCHVDEERDAVYCDSDEKLKLFGKMDATAVARYFGLKSSVLDVDYSQYPLFEASSKTAVKQTLNDTSAPDICRIELLSVEESMEDKSSSVTLHITAADADSALVYYSYSLDGGKTFSAREPWPGSDALTGEYQGSFTLPLPVLPDRKTEVIVRAYNQYDLYTESNVCVAAEEPGLAAEEPGLADADVSEDLSMGNLDTEPSVSGSNNSVEENLPAGGASKDAGGNGMDYVEVLALCLGLASFLLIVLTIVQGITYHNRRKRRLHKSEFSD